MKHASIYAAADVLGRFLAVKWRFLKPAPFLSLLLGIVLVGGMTGCKCVCPANKNAGLATIVCQPMDTTVAQGGQATFEVKAVGKNLIYQWYFNNNEIQGARDPQLVVSGATAAKVGFYHCELDSADSIDTQTRTRTRSAALGLGGDSVSTSAVPRRTDDRGGIRTYSAAITSTATNPPGGNSYPPQHQPLPPPSSGTSICGAYCGYVVYNNGGAGFSGISGTTKAFVRVSTSSGTVANTCYELLWRVNATVKGCATIVTGSTTDRTWNSTAGTKYFLTVYFKPGCCPPAGTDVILDVWFTP